MADLVRPTKTMGTRQYQTEYAAGQRFAKDVEVDADLDTIYNAWNTLVPPALGPIEGGSAIQTVGISNPLGTHTPFGSPQVELNGLTLGPAEVVGLWELVLVQATISVNMLGTPPTNLTVQLNLRRGTNQVLSRLLQWTSEASFSTIDSYPVTMVHLVQIDELSHQWSLWGAAGSVPATGGPLAACEYAQIYAVQFR